MHQELWMRMHSPCPVPVGLVCVSTINPLFSLTAGLAWPVDTAGLHSCPQWSHPTSLVLIPLLRSCLLRYPPPSSKLFLLSSSLLPLRKNTVLRHLVICGDLQMPRSQLVWRRLQSEWVCKEFSSQPDKTAWTKLILQ